MTAHFVRGPAYGLSAEVNRKISQKYDPQKEEELRLWIEDVTSFTFPENFMEGLKSGVVLCELINKLQPGAVKSISGAPQNWHQMDNIGNFLKAITRYGVKPHDLFEANDLFENCNLTQVQTTLLALASVAKLKGHHVPTDLGVRYAEKCQRAFNSEMLKAGQNVISLQMGTNKFASQQGMTAYGTRRHLYDPKTGAEKPLDQTTISLQMGTNKGATQAGMTAPGTRRHIFDNKLGLEKYDSSFVSLQMGSNQGASQKGMTVYGMNRPVCDPKYCPSGCYPLPEDGSYRYTSGSEGSEGEYQDNYHRYNQHLDHNQEQTYQDFE
ncbi:calponin-1-like [Callorhinchus milii]|uniref:Calponin n=1 Tax=Callorhinchus milii TaxID=7868 RepID=V9KK39_CALMI|nr:calponin-1-like [Callorhinchus milii]